MRSKVFAALIAVVALASAPAAAHAQVGGWTPYDRPATYGTVTDKDVPIVMRDGTVLYADVERPDKPGRYPVLITQTPYGKSGLAGAALGGGGSYFVQRGYVQVTVDVRGTGASQGVWDSFGEPEQRDGYDTVEWAANQPWSDGNIGLNGPSYMAITQITTAALKPPHLKAIFPVVPMADGYRDITFSGGDINVSFIPLWMGLVTVGGITPDPNGGGLLALLQHVSGVVSFQANTLVKSATGDPNTAFDGAFWNTRSPIELLDKIDVPTFVVGGLHDIFQRGEPIIYERLKKRVPAKLLIGPWTHVDGSMGAGLPQGGLPSLSQLQLRWFDRWLKGIDTHIGKIPNVTQYTYGSERYETATDWPVRTLAPKTLHLRGGKGLSEEPPKSPEASQSFVQHPLSGICTMSTEQWLAGLSGHIPCDSDERPNELSGGVTYATAPLADDLHVNGPLAAHLWLTTTASDAAVTVRVADVSPDGKVRAMTDGWETASFRALDKSRSRYVAGHLLQPWHPFTKASVLPVKVGEPTAVDVEIFPTDVVFKKGHRIKVTIDPADFPHQIPPLPSLLRRLGGQVKILTDPAHDSTLELPVVTTKCARSKTIKKSVRRHGHTVVKKTTTCAALPVPDLTRAG